MGEIEDTEDYKKGVAAAEADRALFTPPDPTVATVSLDRRPDREYFKMCLKCGWARGSGKCKCDEGVEE